MGIAANASDVAVARRTWKQVALISAFSGAGFALLLAVIIGAAIWYGSRPKPWNNQALTATFVEVAFFVQSEANYKATFSYDVRNNTSATYTLSPLDMIVMAKLGEAGSLSRDFGTYQTAEAKIGGPEFVPAKSVARITVDIPYRVPLEASEVLDDSKVAKSFARRLKELYGFVIFDKVAHYRIDLPQGWQDWPQVKNPSK